MTAATKGAIVGALWAAVLLAFLAVIETMRQAHGVFALAEVLYEPKAFDTSPMLVVGASVSAAATVGAAFGKLALRVVAQARTRAMLLALAAFPALYVVLALALTIIWVPKAAKEGFVATILVPIGSLLYAAYGMVMVVPVAVIPAVLAAVMLEGWTRPDGQGRHGTAHPRVLRWTMGALIVLMVALAAFAVLQWPRS